MTHQTPEGVHRETLWRDLQGRVVQVEVACLDQFWEPLVSVTEDTGPFYDHEHALGLAVARCHQLGGWRAHQLELPLG